MKNANKRTTNQKHNTLTENIIPMHKQQYIKEKWTYQNTRYVQTGEHIQEQATPQKKDIYQMKDTMTKISQPIITNNRRG